ncbi:hypothetical protein BKA70DRAFT_1314271 [Coprinopsis sp. MPI-PUGE-AT-0042]|nr:hypothetical protein BKA70DRAFT_1314271 [Coprinopsis sp. MPI-PUGE-AT-0042]
MSDRGWSGVSSISCEHLVSSRPRFYVVLASPPSPFFAIPSCISPIDLCTLLPPLLLLFILLSFLLMLTSHPSLDPPIGVVFLRIGNTPDTMPASPSSSGLGYVADGSIMPIDRMVRFPPSRLAFLSLLKSCFAHRTSQAKALSNPWVDTTKPSASQPRSLCPGSTTPPNWTSTPPTMTSFSTTVTSALRCLEANPAPDLLCALWSSVCSRMSVGREIGASLFLPSLVRWDIKRSCQVTQVVCNCHDYPSALLVGLISRRIAPKLFAQTLRRVF